MFFLCSPAQPWVQEEAGTEDGWTDGLKMDTLYGAPCLSNPIPFTGYIY